MQAALLVAPPGFADLPRANLPFKAIVVASRTDPYCTFADSQSYAKDWGAELIDRGKPGLFYR